MSYQLKRKIYIAVLVIGILALGVNITLYIMTDILSKDLFLSLCTVSVPLLTCSGLWLGSEIYYKAFPLKAMKACVSNQDERNIVINQKAAYMLFHIMAFILIIALLFFLFIKNYSALYVISTMIFIYAILFYSLRHYYKKRL